MVMFQILPRFWTHVGLVSSFGRKEKRKKKIYSGIYNEDFKVFYTGQGTWIRVFDGIYVSDTVSGPYVMQYSSNMGNIGLVSIYCFERGMDP
jgi:hypothetical protein